MSWPSLADLSQRSQQLELLDADDIPQADLWRNLDELERINALLGGHRATLLGLERLMLSPARSWKILDIGCGGGDTLAQVQAWGQRRGLRLQLTGVDLHADAIVYAERACAGQGIEFIQADYRDLDLEPDLIISSLLCHHLNPDALQDYFEWMRRQGRYGFVINDLHRHPLAYHAIKALTYGLSGSELVRNDAPLSVWRGFSRTELKQQLAQAGLRPQIEWVWAFRWLVYGYV